MEFERSDEWYWAQAKLERDHFVSAGPAKFPASEKPGLVTTEVEVKETLLAFSKFVNQMRRSKGFSVEKLAEEADLDPGELLVIEHGLTQSPEPRVVYQLAKAFDVSQKRLMQLAGHSIQKDASLTEQAVRFAARSESVQKLSKDEKAALEEFVAVLSERHKRK